MIYDVAIIGGGPAGLSAAIYAARANHSTVFIEKGAPGGKMVKTSLIENWSGDESVTGPELSLRMFNHAKKYANYKYGQVIDIKSYNPFKHEVILKDGQKIVAKSVIIATGTVEKVPKEVENIYKFENKGVSYCAICDGPLFKGLPMAVIGSGQSAVEESIYLSSIASKVHLFIRNDRLKADPLQNQELLNKKNVQIYFNSTVKKLMGENALEKLIANVNGEKKTFEVKALYPYIGLKAISDFTKNLNITEQDGYIKTNENMETKVPGVYAVGDVRVKHIRQISTAVADGTIAGKLISNR